MTDIDGHILRTNERLQAICKQLSSNCAASYADAAAELLQWCEDVRAFRKEFEYGLLDCLSTIYRACVQPGFDLELGFRVLAVCSRHRDKFAQHNATQLTQWIEELGRLVLLKHQEKTSNGQTSTIASKPDNSANLETPVVSENTSMSCGVKSMEQIQHAPCESWNQVSSHHQFSAMTPIVNTKCIGEDFTGSLPSLSTGYARGPVAPMYSAYVTPTQRNHTLSDSDVIQNSPSTPSGPVQYGLHLGNHHFNGAASDVHNMQNNSGAAATSVTAAVILEQQHVQEQATLAQQQQQILHQAAPPMRVSGKSVPAASPHVQRNAPYPNAYTHMMNKRPVGNPLETSSNTANGHINPYPVGLPSGAGAHPQIRHINQPAVRTHWTSGSNPSGGAYFSPQAIPSAPTLYPTHLVGHSSGAMPAVHYNASGPPTYPPHPHTYHVLPTAQPPPNMAAAPQNYMKGSTIPVPADHLSVYGPPGGARPAIASHGSMLVPPGMVHSGMAALSPVTQPLDNELRLTFNVRDGTVLAPFRLEHNLAVSNHAFNLKESVFGTLMSRQDLELQLKCFHHEDRNMTCNWPASVSVSVNSHPLSIERGGPDGRLTHKPLFIKAFCHPCKNSVQISVTACCCSHLFLLQMVHRPSVRSVLHGLWRKRKLPADHCISKIKRMFGNGGCGGAGGIVTNSSSSPAAVSEPVLEQTALRMSLKCPISARRINLPARGHDCKHVHCFDLDSYLRMNADRNTWRCPHCSKSAPLEGLEIDEYIFGILENADAATEEVTIDANSRWSAASKAISAASLPSSVVLNNDEGLLAPKIENKSENGFLGECANSTSAISAGAAASASAGSMVGSAPSPYAMPVGTPQLPPNTPEFTPVHTPGGSVPLRPPSRPSSSTLYLSQGGPRTPAGGPPSVPPATNLYSVQGPGSVGPATPGGNVTTIQVQRPASATLSVSTSTAQTPPVSGSNYISVAPPTSDDLSDLTLAPLDSGNLPDIGADDLEDLPDMSMLDDPDELLSYL